MTANDAIVERKMFDGKFNENNLCLEILFERKKEK